MTDSAGALTDDVAGTIAPVDAAAQPVLTTVTDSVGTLGSLTNDAATCGAGGRHRRSPAWRHDWCSRQSTTAAAPSHPTTDASDPADTGTLAGDALASAAPVVDAIEPALTPTAAAPSHPTSDVSDPADTGNVAGDALASVAPVVDAIEPVLTPTAAAPSDPTTDVSHSTAPDTSSGSQASEPADTLLALATATDAPIEVPASATDAPANVVTDVSDDAAAIDPAPVAGDVIALNDAPSSPADALFTGNQYTDYGVTLSSDIVVPPQDAASPTDAASAHDTSVPAVADAKNRRHRLPTSWI